MEIAAVIIALIALCVGFGASYILMHNTSKSQQQLIDTLQTQIERLGEQLKITSEQVLKDRAGQLSDENNREISALLSPLRENIKEMRSAIDSSRDLNSRNSAQLQEAIADVLRHTETVGREADKLSRALRHENKTQGTWGETVLSELLESQGLRRGINYDIQTALTDDQGHTIVNERTESRMIPDVVLHYTDNRDLIIDAKTSLSAFLDYNAATDAAERQDALQRHIRSIRDHAKELARKDYKRYVQYPRQSVDYMIMFVPVESALRLALDAEPRLWREALEMGVFISGEQSLTAALRIIQLSWRQEQQALNQRKVVDEAESLLERVGQFYKSFTEIGNKIQSLTNTYTDTEKKLKTGRQSLLVPAQRLKEMGHKMNPRYPLPEPESETTEEAGMDSPISQ
ncbi:MAG: DNA recombination protein RmuC [Muribaculum sp.]|nr:DNA recombination protein RmuC [Muribaculum sp.]